MTVHVHSINDQPTKGRIETTSARRLRPLLWPPRWAASSSLYIIIAIYFLCGTALAFTAPVPRQGFPLDTSSSVWASRLTQFSLSRKPRSSLRLQTENSEQTATQKGDGNPFQVTIEGDYSYKNAIRRTLGWVGAAITFGSCVWAITGSQPGEEFFAGYLVEQSLSVDNLFVFLLLFDYFQVPMKYQDRVLNWGIYGAIVMRGIMICAGEVALQNFRGILLVFAGILVYGSAKFFLGGEDEEEDPSENSIVQFSRKLIDSVDYFDKDRFFTVVDGVRKATPLFICMIAVEISDVVFAIDSIPAVFGVTEVSFLWPKLSPTYSYLSHELSLTHRLEPFHCFYV